MAHIDQSDLQARVGSAQVAKLFDDDGDGMADLELVSGACEDASALFDSYALEGWDSNGIARLVSDPILRRHISWVALHYRAQGKPEWRDASGVAMYRTEFDDACKHFDRLAKARARSRNEREAGGNVQSRGRVQQAIPTFVIAPSRNNPKGPGGF